jgi:hypothetical protein
MLADGDLQDARIAHARKQLRHGAGRCHLQLDQAIARFGTLSSVRFGAVLM